MTPDTTPSSHWLPSTISMPRLDDDAVIQIHDFIHQVLDLFEAALRRFVWKATFTMGGRSRALWACGQVASAACPYVHRVGLMS
jgi:hypothetical protein